MTKKEVCGADATAISTARIRINYGDAYGFKMGVKLRIQVEGSPRLIRLRQKILSSCTSARPVNALTGRADCVCRAATDYVASTAAAQNSDAGHEALR